MEREEGLQHTVRVLDLRVMPDARQRDGVRIRRSGGLPAATVVAAPAAGRRIVDRIRSEGFEGLVTVDYPGRGALVLALTRVPRAHELVRARASDAELMRAVALFARRTRAFGGAHALLVVDGSREGDPSPSVLGLFEAVLVRHD